MWWRTRSSEFFKQVGEGNRRALRRLVDSGEVPGILGYSGGKPIAWCSVAPRRAFAARMGPRSRIGKAVGAIDDSAIWSVVCFFIDRNHRRRGLMVELLKAAVAFSRMGGAEVLEAYPVEPQAGRLRAAEAYTGLAATFKAAGFVEVIRAAPERPIMRLQLSSLGVMGGS
jgi:GNAT superfamily N-acetyltransferase